MEKELPQIELIIDCFQTQPDKSGHVISLPLVSTKADRVPARIAEFIKANVFDIRFFKSLIMLGTLFTVQVIYEVLWSVDFEHSLGFVKPIHGARHNV
jgi:hypothetical protein